MGGRGLPALRLRTCADRRATRVQAAAERWPLVLWLPQRGKDAMRALRVGPAGRSARVRWATPPADVVMVDRAADQQARNATPDVPTTRFPACFFRCLLSPLAIMPRRANMRPFRPLRRAIPAALALLCCAAVRRAMPSRRTLIPYRSCYLLALRATVRADPTKGGAGI